MGLSAWIYWCEQTLQCDVNQKTVSLPQKFALLLRSTAMGCSQSEAAATAIIADGSQEPAEALNEKLGRLTPIARFKRALGHSLVQSKAAAANDFILRNVDVAPCAKR
eukprot:s2210_g1.t1